MIDRRASEPARGFRPEIRLLRPAFDRLAEIAKLEEDWDTYDGLPPTCLAVASAGQLIIAAAERLGDDVGEAVAPYGVMPFPDGGVQVTWRRAAGELQVDVGPHGSFGYLRIDREDGERTASEAESVSFPDIVGAIEHFLR
jgi:hypothetical protein